jgi:DUF1680 family protein
MDGRAFFYVNPLLVREGGTGYQGGPAVRAPWYACACCPPNLMRLIASIDQMAATTHDAGLVITQFLGGELRVPVPGGDAHLRITTDQPWQGTVEVEVVSAPDGPWSLGLRVPRWAERASVLVTGAGGGTERQAVTADDRIATLERRWVPGDRARLELDQRPRLTFPDRRIDALRGTVALEFGPLVYCVEQVDVPDGADLADVAIPEDASPTLGPHSEELGAPTLEVPVVVVGAGAAPEWPYAPAPAVGEGRARTLSAVPYHRWANRGRGAMRVWIPTTRTR